MNYINTNTLEYPVSESQIRQTHTNTSFPIPFSPPEGFEPVLETTKPEHDHYSHKVIEEQPIKRKNKWIQKWKLVELNDEEKQTNANQFVSECESRIRLKLDEFARQRGYDSILSACTYATSKVARFKAEGQKAVNIRDQVWDAFYKAIDAGVTSYREIEEQLPPMAW